MSDLDAQTTLRFEFGGELVGHDGYRARFLCDDSFASWWAIVRWNWHYGHWEALATNASDLLTKVLRRKLWRPS
jgi:hypothetical protein